MDSIVAPLPFDPASVSGLSQRLLESHHANNYAGAVKRLNAIRAQLRQVDFVTVPGFHLNGLKREELIAANSMALHELYFEGLAGDAHAIPGGLELALMANYGSVARWRDEFAAIGKALGGGSGWVVLTFRPHDGTLMNQWAADHTCLLAGGVPLLALDMYEHAYHLDYGAAAGRYVDAFMASIKWRGAGKRFAAAVHAASEPLAATTEDAQRAVLLDVRRAAVYAAAKEMAAGAQWKDPALVDEWGPQLSPGQPVVVYCVYGHEVGRGTAMRLKAAGVDARFLHGGFDAWKSAGLPMQDKTGGEQP